MRRFFLFWFTGILLSCTASWGTLLAQYDSWSALQREVTQGLLCVAFAKDEKSGGWFSVDELPGTRYVDNISVFSERSFLKDSTVELIVDGYNTYPLRALGTMAILRDREDTRRLLQDIARATRIQVHGTDSQNSPISLVFSTSGFTQAYNLVVETCFPPKPKPAAPAVEPPS